MMSLLQKSTSYNEYGKGRLSKAEVTVEILQNLWKGSGRAFCRAQDGQDEGRGLSGLSWTPRGRKP